MCRYTYLLIFTVELNLVGIDATVSFITSLALMTHHCVKHVIRKTGNNNVSQRHQRRTEPQPPQGICSLSLQKFGKVRPSGFWDMRASRQTRHTDIHITIIRTFLEVNVGTMLLNSYRSIMLALFLLRVLRPSCSLQPSHMHTLQFHSPEGDTCRK